MKEIVNVVYDESKPIEGKEYYYMVSGGKIDSATCVYCEACQKICTVNSVGIVSFNTPSITIKVNKMMENAEELAGYDETLDLCVCNDCSTPYRDEV